MEVYPVSEDTLLMLEHIRCGKKVLEVGTGNGAIAIECAKSGSSVLAVDIDKDAVKRLREEAKIKNLKIETRVSDLFENVDGKYDTIIFNPPYLPGNPKDLKDLQWAGGGKYGDEIILKFLDVAWKYLADDGEIYIILSSFNRLNKIFEMPYKFEKIAQKKFSFHEIYLYRAKKIKER